MLKLSFSSGEEHANRFAVALLAEQKAMRMVDELPLALRADVLAVQMEDDIERNEARLAHEAAGRRARELAIENERALRAKRYAEVVEKRADFPMRFALFRAIYGIPRKK